jgi:hypothetical protein
MVQSLRSNKDSSFLQVGEDVEELLKMALPDKCQMRRQHGNFAANVYWMPISD